MYLQKKVNKIHFHRGSSMISSIHGGSFNEKNKINKLCERSLQFCMLIFIKTNKVHKFNYS